MGQKELRSGRRPARAEVGQLRGSRSPVGGHPGSASPLPSALSLRTFALKAGSVCQPIAGARSPARVKTWFTEPDGRKARADERQHLRGPGRGAARRSVACRRPITRSPYGAVEKTGVGDGSLQLKDGRRDRGRRLGGRLFGQLELDIHTHLRVYSKLVRLPTPAASGTRPPLRCCRIRARRRSQASISDRRTVRTSVTLTAPAGRRR